MAEKEEIFSSKMKYEGLWDFKEFYKFCYQWLVEEMHLDVIEDKYSEKITGDSKGIKIEWTGKRKVTDYFQFSVSVKFEIIGLINVEITKDGRKIRLERVEDVEKYFKTFKPSNEKHLKRYQN